MSAKNVHEINGHSTLCPYIDITFKLHVYRYSAAPARVVVSRSEIDLPLGQIETERAPDVCEAFVW